MLISSGVNTTEEIKDCLLNTESYGTIQDFSIQ